ncbi:hypothetical protein [Deminuibacter soli]|uniref:Heavy-metal-associated domain-containing protein n=1 Tax=Deminuibacter soli TaxID=2291815 RepID=A0A3E1NQK5_9BACT|nr:hypothetical protein [Deminuibacter soli]RFM30104.1 hypothetical protein DXN05_03780 [Deminuibacter soli]
MPKLNFRKIALTTVAVFAGLVLLLAVHLYMVTRPQAPDVHTRIMARVDFAANVGAAQGDTVTAFLYSQPGVDHVLFNPVTHIAIFTFAPIQTSATAIIARLQQTLPYKAKRIQPSEEEMAAGCPVASNTATSRVLRFFRHLN